MFRVPDSVVTRRPISLQGAVVPAGTTLSKEQVEALGKSLNSLLDSGYVVANPDAYARKGKARPQPSSLPPVIRNAMVGRITAGVAAPSLQVKTVGDSVSLVVSDGVAPFTVTVDETGQADTKSSRTFSFSGLGAGSFTAHVFDGSGQKGSVSFVIDSHEEEPKKPKKRSEGQ